MQEDGDYVHLQPAFKCALQTYCAHIDTEEDKPKEGSQSKKLATPTEATAQNSPCVACILSAAREAWEPKPPLKERCSQGTQQQVVFFSFACVAKMNRVCFAISSVSDFLCDSRMSLLSIDTFMYRLLGFFSRRKTMSP